jgi:hypothetical protein
MRSAICTWLQVAPPFWARPAASWVIALALHVGRHAQQLADGDDAGAAHAGHHDAPGALGHGQHRLGHRGRVAAWPATGAGFFSVPPVTVTKLGQKPFTQDRSWLQLLWLIWRLRPNSVSSGSTETQLLFTEQSPQPSQTRG